MTERRRYVDTDGTEVEVATYHGRPVVKPPEWTWEVPWYLFAGGVAGASSAIALAARVTGDEVLADRARLIAAAGAAVSPPLLIADLGRPARFLNMLRVLRPSSVMSVGSWILASYSTVLFGGLGLRTLDRAPRLQTVADGGAAVLGLGMSTYTGALVADTSIPVWHGARKELPVLFAASSLAGAGAATTLATLSDPRPATRRLAAGGAIVELAVDTLMRRRLGPVGEVYEQQEAGRFHQAATAATATGAALVAAGGRRRRGLAALGSALLLAGGVCTRWSVYKAGFQSARDPVATLGPQRARLVRRRS